MVLVEGGGGRVLNCKQVSTFVSSYLYADYAYGIMVLIGIFYIETGGLLQPMLSFHWPVTICVNKVL